MKNTYLLLIFGAILVLSSCTQNKNEFDEYKLLDGDQSEVFDILLKNNEYTVRNHEVDQYFRKEFTFLRY